MNNTNTFLTSLKWSLASEFITKAISPLVFIILSRLLEPHDFGVMAAATMVIAFSQIFWEAGMGKALIQRQDNISVAANAAFFSNITLGLIVSTMIFLFSDWVAQKLFQDIRVGSVLRYMSLQVFLGALSSVHIALLQKAMKFDYLFKVRLFTVGIPALASIPMALSGMGYWSLVAGALTGQIAQMLFLWKVSDWRPNLVCERVILVDMIRFGIWVAASALLGWFYNWADSLIIGMYLGSHELGIYRNGSQFVVLIFSVPLGALLPVVYSYFSKKSSNGYLLKQVMEKAMMTLSVIVLPMTFILFTISEPLADLIFGDKWQGIGFVIGVMGLSHGYAWIVGLNGEAYRANGKPHCEVVIMLLAFCIYLPLYTYAIGYGFEFFVWMRLIASVFVGLTLHFFFIKKFLGVQLKRIFLRIVSISLVSILLIRLLDIIIPSDVSSIYLIGLRFGVMMIVYSILFYYFERHGLIEELVSIVCRKRDRLK